MVWDWGPPPGPPWRRGNQRTERPGSRPSTLLWRHVVRTEASVDKVQSAWGAFKSPRHSPSLTHLLTA